MTPVDGGDFRCGSKEGGDRRRRAFVDVGRPHMERHRRDLEGEADGDQHDADDEADRDRAAIGEIMRQRVEAGRPGKAVDHRRAIEQHARGERTEDEIFETGFGRADIVAMKGGDDVKRQALQFE